MFLSICVAINHEYSRTFLFHMSQYGSFAIKYNIITHSMERCVDALFDHAVTIKSKRQCCPPKLTKIKNSRGRWACGPRMTVAALAAIFALQATSRANKYYPLKVTPTQ